MSMRAIKHFVVTWKNGKLLISQAREIVPNRVYEIVKFPEPQLGCSWNFGSEQTFPIHQLGIKEKKKSSDF